MARRKTWIQKFLCLTLVMLLVTACADSKSSEGEAHEALKAAPVADAEPGYDAALAASLGADDYGMRSYVFATLVTGPKDAAITDEAERAQFFKGHFSNMSRLASEGKLVLAGPFMEAAPKRGLYIFNVATIAEAEKLVQSDPAIAAGIFNVELDKYYGSAALMQLNDLHAKIQKTKIE